MERDMLALMEPEQEQGTSIHERLLANINNPNIAEDLDDTELSAIGQKVIREYDIDLGSRSEWEERSRTAMDLAMQIAKPKTSPWPNSSNVIFPLMTTAAVQFAARAYPAIVQGRNVVKGVVVGKDDGVPMPPEMVQQLMGMGGRPGGVPGPMPGMGAPGMDPGMPMQTPQGAAPQAGMMGHNGGPPMEQGQQPVWIVPPGAKRERATRVGDHMSWQLLEEMESWEEDTDKLLHILPIVGCTFRKSYYDRGVRHNCSDLVLAENLVIDYRAKSMERAPRVTERIWFYPYEITEQIRAGLFLDQDYQKANSEDEDAPVEFLEQHRWLDLDDDGYPEPYIVTVHKQTSKVARITARYDAEGVELNPQTGDVLQIDPVHYYTKYDFLPNPDGGIYGVGFGQLLAPINEAVNTTLNQLFDAGSLQNNGGGFIGRGVSMHAGSLKFRLGEWKMVNTPGMVLKDAIVPFSHAGPSAQLVALLTFLIEAGKEIASVKDVLSGETAAATMQPTTLMALIEQGLKVFTAIFKRVHRSLKKELDKLYRLNRVYLQQQAQYQVGDEWRTVTKQDYERGGGVTPYSDPTMVSDMQRMAKAQFLQSYQNDPNCNRVEIIRRVMDAAQIEDPDKIIVEQTPPNPAILAQTAELELKEKDYETKAQSAKASQIRDLSTAVLNLAKADTENLNAPLEWTAQYISLLEMQLKALMAPAEGQGQPPVPQLPEILPPMPGGIPPEFAGMLQ
jgi:chaperonin GroES